MKSLHIAIYAVVAATFENALEVTNATTSVLNPIARVIGDAQNNFIVQRHLRTEYDDQDELRSTTSFFSNFKRISNVDKWLSKLKRKQVDRNTNDGGLIMTDLNELKDILQLVDTKQIDHQLIKNLVEMLLLKDEKELMLRLQLAVEYNTMDTKLAKKLQSVVFNMWYHEAETFPLYKVFELTGVDFTAMKECHCIDPLEKRMMQAFLAHVKRKRREKVSDKVRKWYHSHNG